MGEYIQQLFLNFAMLSSIQELLDMLQQVSGSIPDNFRPGQDEINSCISEAGNDAYCKFSLKYPDLAIQAAETVLHGLRQTFINGMQVLAAINVIVQIQ